MDNFTTLTEYCKKYKLNSSRIKDYYEKGLLPDTKKIKGVLYFPDWMYKYNKNIIKNASKITNRYTAIMKAVNKEIHLNYKMCKTTKKTFLEYLNYLVKEDVIYLNISTSPNRIESYLPTLKLLKDSKVDYYKLSSLIFESWLKATETAVNIVKP